MLRDCQKKYYSRDTEKDGESRRCQNRTVKFRKYLLNAEYCFCLGNYCNGDGSLLGKTVSSQLGITEEMKNRDNQRNGSNLGWPTCSLQYLIIYAICLKLLLVSLPNMSD